MRVDDRVRLSETGRRDWGPSVKNPHDAQGTIIEIDHDGEGKTNRGHYKYLNVVVLWDNEHTNQYNDEDLELLGSIVPVVALGKRITVRCRIGNRCSRCVQICPTRALWCEDGRIHIRRELCSKCGLCIEACNEDAIRFEEFGAVGHNLNSETKDAIADRFRSEARAVVKMKRWLRDYGEDLEIYSERLAEAYATEISNEDEEAKQISAICLAANRLLRTCHNLPLELSERVGEMLANGAQPSPRETAKREIEGVLQFFEHVRFTGRTLYACTKEDAILEGVNFGKFAIAMSIPEGSLVVRAIDPNWPEKRARSHPHLEHDHGGICLGVGGDAYQKALTEGRICDALLIIRSVLNTYGDENPYQDIDEWRQQRCDVCSEEGAHYRHRFCGGDRRICKDHAVYCSNCGIVLCFACVMECDECGAALCVACAERGKCEHKEDIRNRNWQRRIEDARQEQKPERLQSERERALNHVRGKIGLFETWREEEELRRKEEEERRERQREWEEQARQEEGQSGFLPEDS
jgi:ferredoxin